MKILNIHAGITDKEIVEFLFEPKKEGDNIIKSIIEEAEELGRKEAEIKKQKEKQGLIYFEKKMWIFLDEINTCNCMGLICEIMTKNSCQGKELPKSLVFIGACNPYRMATKNEEPNGLKLKDAKEKKLVYTVNPLPHSLLNFVFNFGSLTEKDEQSYIRNMVVSPVENFYWKEVEQNKEKKPEPKKEENNNKEEKKIKTLENYLSKEKFEQLNKLKKIASDAIIEAQDYVRKKNDVSSVSLREIRRFSIFYSFFVEYLRNKKILFSNMKQNENYEVIDIFYKNLTDYDIYKYSINLSVFVCYYLRLTKKEFRDDFSLKMNKHFGFDFKEMPKKEQEYISNNIEMKAGIAKNRALLENIFTLFVCVNAKVPLFIVGKPGCSKSLSVQLLFKSMKGEISDNILFKTLPKLILHSYQGSLGSTSKGVLSIFKKARAILERKSENNVYYNIFKLFGYFGEAIFNILINNDNSNHFNHKNFLSELNSYNKNYTKSEIMENEYLKKLISIYDNVISLIKNRIIIFKEISVFLIIMRLYENYYSTINDFDKVLEILKYEFSIIYHIKDNEYKKIYDKYYKKLAFYSYEDDYDDFSYSINSEFPKSKKNYINYIRSIYKKINRKIKIKK
jgi:hypothetical protein